MKSLNSVSMSVLANKSIVILVIDERGLMSKTPAEVFQRILLLNREPEQNAQDHEQQ